MCSRRLSASPSYRVLGRSRLVSSRRLSHRTLPSKRPALQPLQRNATVMHHMQALAAERQPPLPHGCFPDGLHPEEEGLSRNAPWDIRKGKHSLACESCIKPVVATASKARPFEGESMRTRQTCDIQRSQRTRANICRGNLINTKGMASRLWQVCYGAYEWYKGIEKGNS
jgi:hypothetical protein